MNINNVWWWILVLVNASGFFVYKFALISRGLKKEIVKSVGLICVGISYLTILLIFGWGSFLLVLVLVPLITTPIMILLMGSIEDKLYPERIKLREKYHLTPEQYSKTGENTERKINDFMNRHVK